MNIRRKLLQNRISESRWAPAVMSFFSISVWTMVCINDTFAIVPLLCMLFSTFLMMELNNTNALIRIFSRMVSLLLYGAHYYGNFQFVSIKSCQCSTLYSRFLHLFVSLLSRQVFARLGILRFSLSWS